jgi:uncharacterized membrane protein (DUF4010 family)
MNPSFKKLSFIVISVVIGFLTFFALVLAFNNSGWAGLYMLPINFVIGIISIFISYKLLNKRNNLEISQSQTSPAVRVALFFVALFCIGFVYYIWTLFV